ncbi:MAG: bifunctional adenosylcobinamide kinase/adenosylcobinamide-phosphate guanylyltransferase [Acidimicrobiales bacterium]
MRLDPGLTLLLGGARSGKSDLAVELGRSWLGPVTFAATAEPIDDDMTRRIDRHRLDRPGTWQTIEAPCFGVDGLADVPPSSLLILDCLTLLVSNLMLAELDQSSIDTHIGDLAKRLSAREGPSIVVSNEVGMGIHPETPLGRAYRDRLGTANRIVADEAASALLLVAGRAVPLERIAW